MSAPSILRSAGTVPPASLTKRRQHVDVRRRRHRRPCRRRSCPATRRCVGSRTPPSQVVPLPPRSGPATPPSLPCVSHGPLSLVKMHQRALVELQFAQRVEHPAHAPVHFLDPVAVAAVGRLARGRSRPDGSARARRCAAGRGRTGRSLLPRDELHRLVGVALDEPVLLAPASVSTTCQSRTSGSGGRPALRRLGHASLPPMSLE